MEHKTIKVSYARPKCEETRGTNLYIRNLPGREFAKLEHCFLQDFFSRKI